MEESQEISPLLHLNLGPKTLRFREQELMLETSVFYPYKLIYVSTFIDF